MRDYQLFMISSIRKNNEKNWVVSKPNVLSIYLSYPDYISIKIDARQLRDFLSS